MVTGWCYTLTLKAGSDTSPFSPPVTFLMSRWFAQGAVTHLLWTRTTEQNDLIRQAAPSRGKRTRSPIARLSQSEKYAVINYFWEGENSLALSLPPERRKFWLWKLFFHVSAKGTFLLRRKLNFKWHLLQTHWTFCSISLLLFRP